MVMVSLHTNKNLKEDNCACLLLALVITPRYFILFEAIVKDTTSLIYFSICFHFYIGNATDFFELNFVPSSFAFISCRNSPGELMYTITSSANKDILTYFLIIYL